MAKGEVMSHIQMSAVAVEAGVAYNTVKRYRDGGKLLRISRKAIEAALVRLGWIHLARPVQ